VIDEVRIEEGEWAKPAGPLIVAEVLDGEIVEVSMPNRLHGFVVYIAATGEIVRTGGAYPDAIWQQPLEPGEALMIGEADATTQHVRDGRIVNK
jgi:hypothetical protein